jgi:subtilisin-like proprotein convertase family protein/S1-C subfamily serine protease
MILKSFMAILLLCNLLACSQASDDESSEDSSSAPQDSADKIPPEPMWRKLDTKMIYGDDDRKNLYEVASPLYRKLADSTVALIKNSELRVLNASDLGLPSGTYGASQSLCTSEVFYSEPAAAFCSGSLVGPNLILTAGHCVTNANDCADARFVFGYAVTQSGKFPQTVAAKETYSCKRIIARKQEAAGADYALIELDRNVVGHEVLKLQRTRPAAVGDALTVIGHPSGLPTKVASGGKVRAVQTGYFNSNLDTYGGNSGSAVFNSETGDVVGILVRGDDDFVMRGQCVVSNRCAADGCRGEDVTRIDQVAALIAPAPPPVTTPEKVFASKSAVAIPDNNARGVESAIQVGESASGKKVLIAVDVEHSFVGDLTLTLTAPDGKSYVLRRNKGGRSRDLVGVFGDTLASETSLASLSKSPAGSWKLKAVDGAAQDAGTLRQWKVIFR